MNIKTGRILSIVFFAGLVLWCLQWYRYKTVPPKMKFLATDFINVDTQEKTSLESQRGKVLIVSCFQTWCRDCAAETPILNQLANKFGSDNFQVIYITDEDNQQLKAFRNRLPSDRIIFTLSGKPLSALGVHVYPTTFLLDKKGNVVLTKLEGYNWEKEESRIQHLIKE